MNILYNIRNFLVIIASFTVNIPCMYSMGNTLSAREPISYKTSDDITASLQSPTNMQDVISAMPPEEIDKAIKAVVSMCEEMLTPVLGMLDTLHKTITRLTQEINVNTIRVADKKKMSQNLTALARNISNLKAHSSTQVDPLQLLLLIKFVQGVTDHLSLSLKSGFKSIDSFDLEHYIIHNPVPVLGENPFAVIQQELINANIKLEALVKKAETAGLSLVNTIFRKIDDYVVEPTLKYKIHTRSGQVIATSGMFLFHLWLFLDNAKQNQDTQNDSWILAKLEKINIMKNFFGWHPPRYRQMDTLEPIKGFFPLFYDYQIRSLHNYLWVPQVLSGAAFMWLWQNDFSDAKGWILKKMSALRNRLKGGEYVKRADVIDNIMPEITFDDIIGLDHIKAKMEEVIEYMLHPERFDRTQALPERGYLFIGDPGCGKTEFAKAIFGEIRKRLRLMGRDENEINFLFPSISAIMEEGVEKLFATALHFKPCIVFIDEIDFLKLQRWSGDAKHLSNFLQFMNGVIDLGPKQQIIFIGATNRAQFLDFALKRPGRFGVQLSFNLPSLKHRKEFIEKLLSKLAIELNPADLESIARTTAGCTYDDIRHIIKGVIRKTQTTGIAFSMQEIENSFDENVRKIVMLDDKVLSSKDQKLLATHQTGHALAHLLLETNKMVAKVTTRPVQQNMKDEGRWQVYDKKPDHEKQRPLLYGKTFTYSLVDSLGLMDEQELHKAGMVLMAGYAAEVVVLGTTHNYHIGFDGDTDDKNEAYQLALNLLLKGIDIRELSKSAQQETRDKAYALLKTWEQEMIALFEKNKELICLIAHTLEAKRSLSGEELNNLINEHKKIATN
jgi:ATP-dependent Zn protease